MSDPVRLSERLSRVKPSATVAVTAKLAELRREGRDIVDFSTGEPDFDTPAHIKDAAAEALRAGQTKYTPVGGTLALKDAIITKLARDNGLTYEPQEIIASCGGKHSLYNAFQAIFQEGDEVIVPAPFWVSYADMLKLAGAIPVILQTEERDGFRLSPAALEDAVTSRTRGVILNSPSNPTGAAYEAADLRALGEVIARHGLITISDDVYERLVYDGFTQRHFLAECPELKSRTIVISSVSKTYAMTGWRLGYTAAPAHVVKAMATIQGQSTTNPTSMTQAGAIAALAGDQSCVGTMLTEFARRRAYVLSRLDAIDGVTCVAPRGAFYVFPTMSAFLGRTVGGVRLDSAGDLARYLLTDCGVAVVGGEDFGAPANIRITYATSLEMLEEGMNRLERGLTTIAAAA